MNKTILFSPVGGTDPISENNFRDGSLLHICRVYQPDIVYMYMSKEILAKHERDDRYRYCLDRLAEQNGHKMEYHIVERRDLSGVNDFDYFYQDFQNVIADICTEMDETDTLLLNTSSGTPQMKSGLLVWATLGEFPFKLIQVATPAKKMNEHTHGDWKAEELWELDEDNVPDYENRCKEVHCPTLSLIKFEDVIKKHLLSYNYAAAIDVADTLPSKDTEGYRELLQMAQARVLLDYRGAENIASKYDVDCFPIKSGNQIKYFEYAMNLEIKLRRREYVDFIRGITPLIVDLFEMMIKEDIGICINDYTYIHRIDEDEVREWSKKKLAGTAAYVALQKRYSNSFKYGPILSEHLKAIIDELSANIQIKSLAEKLRYVEKHIRNMAAHEIVSITEETIKRKTGFSSSEIMNKLKQALSYGGINIKKEYWNSYDDMNAAIISKMESR